MPNLKSSKKDVRRIRKRRVQNRAVRTALKTHIKKVRQAVEEGNADTIKAEMTVAQKHLDKAVKHGVIHKKRGARRKSRIMKQLRAAQNE